jgi:hypothetical protein
MRVAKRERRELCYFNLVQEWMVASGVLKRFVMMRGSLLPDEREK